MADQKVSDLPSLNGADVDAADLLYIIDSSAGSAGSKKITVGQYQLAPVSGGTANGVMYLDGSKVPTAGSSLVFSGGNLLLGVNTNPNSRRLLVNGPGSGATYLSVGDISQTANEVVLGVDPANNLSRLTSTAWDLSFGTNGAEKMRLDVSGNLGLGVTPSAWGSNFRSLDVLSFGASVASSSAGNTLTSVAHNAYNDNTNWIYRASSIGAARYEMTGANAGSTHAWYVSAGGTAGNAISFTQAMTLDADGNLLVGTTTGGGVGISLYNQANNANVARIDLNKSASGASTGMSFRHNGTAVGSIVYSNTDTTYVTTSDYRLKDNPQPLTGSGAFIDALQPKTWTWKTEGTRGVGFIAHEAQAVSPSSVVGEKDAVDEDGKPVMQAMEYGSAEFIANIIAELQSLRARVAALESA